MAPFKFGKKKKNVTKQQPESGEPLKQQMIPKIISATPMGGPNNLNNMINNNQNPLPLQNNNNIHMNNSQLQPISTSSSSIPVTARSAPSPSHHNYHTFQNQPRSVSGGTTSSHTNQYSPWNRYKLTNSPFPRYRHVASSNTTTQDNRIFVIGGLHDQLVYGDTWIITQDKLKNNTFQFNSKTIEITDTTPPPTVGHASTLCGNAFVIFGGDTHKVNKEGLMDDDIYLFNINSYKWTIPKPVGPRPLGRYGHKISIIATSQMKTKLYVFGGQFDDTYFNDLSVYDLSSFRKSDSHWEFLKPISFSPPPLTNHTMVSYNFKLWVFGGDTLQGLINQVFMYDPMLNDWKIIETTGTKPCPMQEHAAVMWGDLMCVMGGKDENDNYLNCVYFLNLKSFKWFKLPEFKINIPQGRSGHSITLLNNTKLLIMGGDKFDYARKDDNDFQTSDVDMGRGTILYTLDLTKITELCPGILNTEKEHLSLNSNAVSTTISSELKNPTTPLQKNESVEKFSNASPQPNILTPHNTSMNTTPKTSTATPQSIQQTPTPVLGLATTPTPNVLPNSSMGDLPQKSLITPPPPPALPDTDQPIPTVPVVGVSKLSHHSSESLNSTTKHSQQTTSPSSSISIPKSHEGTSSLPKPALELSPPINAIPSHVESKTILQQPQSTSVLGPNPSQLSDIGVPEEIGVARVASSSSISPVKYVSGDSLKQDLLFDDIKISTSKDKSVTEEHKLSKSSSDNISRNGTIQSDSSAKRSTSISSKTDDSSFPVLKPDFEIESVTGKDSDETIVIDKKILGNIRSELEDLKILTQKKSKEANGHVKYLEAQITKLKEEKKSSVTSSPSKLIVNESRLDILKADNVSLQNRIKEYDVLFNSKFLNIENLNSIIKEQNLKLKEYQTKDNSTEKFEELEMKYNILKEENSRLKNDLQNSNDDFTKKVDLFSNQLSDMVSEWKNNDDSSNETDKVISNSGPFHKLNTLENHPTVENLHNTLEQLTNANQDLIDDNIKLKRELEELKGNHLELKNEIDEIENNYKSSISSISNTNKALELSQKELDKMKDLNNELQEKIEILQFEQKGRIISEASIQSEVSIGDDNSKSDYRDTHYKMKINDLKAELFIIKQERDSLKDDVHQMKKTLYAMKENSN